MIDSKVPAEKSGHVRSQEISGRGDWNAITKKKRDLLGGTIFLTQTAMIFGEQGIRIPGIPYISTTI